MKPKKKTVMLLKKLNEDGTNPPTSLIHSRIFDQISAGLVQEEILRVSRFNIKQTDSKILAALIRYLRCINRPLQGLEQIMYQQPMFSGE